LTTALRNSAKEKSTEVTAVEEQLKQKLHEVKNRIFVDMCKYTSGFIFLAVVRRAAAAVTTNSGMH